MSDFEEALEIVRKRGNEINQRDLMAINAVLNRMPLEEVTEAKAMVYEAIFLIVNDPQYEGDISPA